MADKAKQNQVKAGAKPNKKVDRFTDSLLPETDERVRNSAGIAMVLALAFAFWLSTMELVVDEIMFEDAEGEELTASMKMEEKKEEKKEEEKRVKTCSKFNKGKEKTRTYARCS